MGCPTSTEYSLARESSTSTESSASIKSYTSTDCPSIMAIERPVLQFESLAAGRYSAFFSDDESQFHVYLVCPDTGVYRFKLVKLHVKLSAQFPEDPPKVRFLHNTRHPIHPAFFVSGRLCLSLLGYVNFGCSSFLSLRGSRTAWPLATNILNRDFGHHTWKHHVEQCKPGMICVRQCLATLRSSGT